MHMKSRQNHLSPAVEVRDGVARMAIALVALSLLSACSPEFGSEDWCRQMSEKSKRDWSAIDTSNYATNCLSLRQSED